MSIKSDLHMFMIAVFKLKSYRLPANYYYTKNSIFISNFFLELKFANKLPNTLPANELVFLMKNAAEKKVETISIDALSLILIHNNRNSKKCDKKRNPHRVQSKLNKDKKMFQLLGNVWFAHSASFFGKFV